ncbi:MAG: acylphosphatase [Phycisphaerales bacterium JB041]
MERRVVMFSGRVQGVGFRVTTREVARGFAVSGWVRNEPDGRVRCEVQGEGGECERFVATVCERMAGYVQEARSEPIPIVREERGFEIRRSPDPRTARDGRRSDEC